MDTTGKVTMGEQPPPYPQPALTQFTHPGYAVGPPQPMQQGYHVSEVNETNRQTSTSGGATTARTENHLNFFYSHNHVLTVSIIHRIGVVI